MAVFLLGVFILSIKKCVNLKLTHEKRKLLSYCDQTKTIQPNKASTETMRFYQRIKAAKSTGIILTQNDKKVQ